MKCYMCGKEHRRCLDEAVRDAERRTLEAVRRALMQKDGYVGDWFSFSDIDKMLKERGHGE